MRDGAAADARALELKLERKLAEAVLSVAARTTTTTTHIALERSAQAHQAYQGHQTMTGGGGGGGSAYQLSSQYHRNAPPGMLQRQQHEDRVQDGCASVSIGSPGRVRRRHRRTRDEPTRGVVVRDAAPHLAPQSALEA